MTSKPRKHNPAWPDSREARAARQANRLSKLNDVARRCGFETWRRLETAVINGARLEVIPLDSPESDF